jgi:hypothetical protein
VLYCNLQLRDADWNCDAEGLRDTDHAIILQCGMMDEVLIYSTTNMQNNFMLFSDLQKRLTPSPIKSWRLLKQLRDNGHMREPEDWMMQDRKLFVNVPRFIVELEQLGYGNMKSDDFKSSDMKSDEIKELVEEMKLISSEITESRIQEEMKSSDFSADESKRNLEQQDLSVKSPQQNLKSDEITFASREIIDAKNEVIDTLKVSLKSKEDDVMQLRAVISDLTQQLKTTTHQNAWLTNLLVAPKQEPEPMRTAKAHDISNDFTDITDEISQDDDMHQEPKPDTHGTGEEVNQEQSTEEINSDDGIQPTS